MLWSGRHAKFFVTFLLHYTFDKNFLLEFINKPTRLKVQNPAENHAYIIKKRKKEDFKSDGNPMYAEKPIGIKRDFQ